MEKKTIMLIFIFFLIAGIFCYFKFIKKTDSINDNQHINEKNKTDEEQENSNLTTSSSSDTNSKDKKNKPFAMDAEDIFPLDDLISVTGKISSGKIKVGDTIQIVGMGKEPITTTVQGIRFFSPYEIVNEADTGNNAAILLNKELKNQIERGQTLIEPDTISPHTRFEADVHILKDTVQGETISFNEYKTQIVFRYIGVIGTISLPDGVETVNKGDDIKVTIELSSSTAMEIGSEFRILSSSTTKEIGEGIVTKIYE